MSTGPLTLALTVSADGRRATLEVSPPPGDNVLLHTRSLAAAGFRREGEITAPEPMTVTAGRPATLQFTR